MNVSPSPHLPIQKIPCDTISRVLGGFYDSGFDFTLDLFEKDDYDFYDLGVDPVNLGLSHSSRLDNPIALAVDRKNRDRFMVMLQLNEQ